MDLHASPEATPSPANPSLFWGVKAAALLGASAVAAGAMGAHALKTRVSPEDLAIWKTGASYQLLHALAILALSVSPFAGTPAARRTLLLWIFGSLIFALTLYAMTLGGPRWLGAITPLGGVCLILGWLSLLLRGPTASVRRAGQ